MELILEKHSSKNKIQDSALIISVVMILKSVNPILEDNPKRTAAAALACIYLFSRFEARPKNLKVASAQPAADYVDIIPDILPNTTSGKLRFLAWLRHVLN